MAQPVGDLLSSLSDQQLEDALAARGAGIVGRKCGSDMTTAIGGTLVLDVNIEVVDSLASYPD